MKHLYELPAEYEAINAEIEESNGELSPELEARLNALQSDMSSTVEAIASLITRHKHSADVYKAEMARLGTHHKTHENAAKRLKDYLQHHMQIMKIDKIKTRLFSVWRQANSAPSIEWTGDGAPPRKYMVERLEPNGTLLQQLNRDGELPDGFKANYGEHLRIK